MAFAYVDQSVMSYTVQAIARPVTFMTVHMACCNVLNVVLQRMRWLDRPTESWTRSTEDGLIASTPSFVLSRLKAHRKHVK